ncbi:MAG: translation initiation factor IF-2 [Oscillospiraceae bacterium]
MIDKYRVHEVAKDLGVPSKDVLALLEQYFPDDQRKHMTALSDAELNMVFDHYTQKSALPSFDPYFEMAKASSTAPAEAPVAGKAPEAVPAEAPAVASASAEVTNSEEAVPHPLSAVESPSTVAPAQAQPAQVQPTQVQPTQAQPTQVQPTQVQPAQAQPTQAQPTQAQPAQAQPTQAQPTQAPRTPQQQPRTQQAAPQLTPQGLRPNLNGQPRLVQPGQMRPNLNGQPRLVQPTTPRPVQQSVPSRPAQQPLQNRTATQQFQPAVQNQGQGQSQSQSQAPTNRVERPAARHVDMRSAQVNLDKYNERYEQIAPTNLASKNQGPAKQKFSGRPQRGKPTRSRREQEVEKMRRLELERQRRQKLEISLPEEISVGDLALRLKVQAAEIIKRLMTMDIMAAVSDIIDYDTAALVAMEIGAKVEHEVVVTIEDRLFSEPEEKEENLSPRCPVVVVMGHVDHGKTSLLDAIRNTRVTAGEAGGITQHIGAYQVVINDQPITFLDTPGHAAFTSMRARGAQVTDIAVLVVAADDGIMPQTVEAINHAKAAGVAIIVAINKVDKPGANPEKVMQSLTEYELVPEEWGGDVICVPVSAKTGENLSTLLEMILLVAETKELTANPDRMAKGTVIEAKLDKGRGPVATVLVQNGTLHTGDAIIAGTSVGRVRVMCNDKGERIELAGPSTPVEIVGLSEVPSAGDLLNAVEDERLAKELADQRRYDAKEEQFKTYQKVTLDNLFTQISEGEMKELPIIVKADVDGSVEAVRQSLEKLSNDEVKVRVIHGAVGAVNESDVMLANASNAIIVGFNVRPDPSAKESAERENVDIRLYRVIYDAINEVTDALKGMLTPKVREKELGRAEVRLVYKISSVGTVAGCYVLEGKITRSALIRIVRDGIIVADDKLESLKRFKDDAKEVSQGYECGMSLMKFSDLKVGDIFEAYEMEEYRE